MLLLELLGALLALLVVGTCPLLLSGSLLGRRMVTLELWSRFCCFVLPLCHASPAAVRIKDRSQQLPSDSTARRRLDGLRSCKWKLLLFCALVG
jgi:hypothetical protein